MTPLEDRLAAALRTLIDEVSDIRGIDVPEYCKEEFREAEDALHQYTLMQQEKINEQYASNS